MNAAAEEEAFEQFWKQVQPVLDKNNLPAELQLLRYVAKLSFQGGRSSIQRQLFLLLRGELVPRQGLYDKERAPSVP